MADKVLIGINMPFTKTQLLKSLCQSRGIDYRTVDASGYGKTLGNLAGITGIPAFPKDRNMGKDPDEEMMIFSGFDQEELFSFLDQMKGISVETASMKAMITMNNVFWSPRMLFEALKDEQKEMEKLRREKK